MDKEHHHVFETENSWNDHWQSEIEFHLSDKENTSLDFEKIEFQNQVEIIDKTNLFTSLYFSYNFVSSENKGDEIEYKLLNEYTNSSVNFITNFIFEKQVGKNSSGSTEFSLSNYLFFKQQIFNCCSEISPIAKKVKAINTLKLKDNKNWIGSNTDIDGFIYPLKNLNLIKKNSIILGSGGAARSVIQGLINLELSQITIISRNKNSINELIANFQKDIKIKGLLHTNSEIDDFSFPTKDDVRIFKQIGKKFY